MSNAPAPVPHTIPVSTGYSARRRAPEQMVPSPTVLQMRNGGGGGFSSSGAGGAPSAPGARARARALIAPATSAGLLKLDTDPPGVGCARADDATGACRAGHQGRRLTGSGVALA